MGTFDEEIARLGPLEAGIRQEIRKRVQELFRDFYPRLSDEEIERVLRLHGHFDDRDVCVVQAFYRTASYRRAVERLGTWATQRGVRTRVVRALQVLPEHTPLHEALTMSYKHLNLYDEEAR